MLPASPLLATLLFSISTVASPVEVRSSGFTLPFAKRINTNGGAINLVQENRARALALKEYATAIGSGSSSAQPTGNVNITTYKPSSAYIASVGVGSPSTSYDLLIDMSTSNIWIGADKPYTPTSTSKNTDQPVGLFVTGQYWNGEEWLDRVTLGPDLVIANQSIGVASTVYGYDAGIDGVLGLGPAFLSTGTLWNQLLGVIPTVTDNLYDQGTIPEDAFSVFLAPSTSGNHTGEIMFGGTDPSKYNGNMIYAPLTKVEPASIFWGFDQTITYGNKTILKDGTGIIDATSSLLIVSSDVYEAYMNVTGGVEDEATQMIKLTPSQYDNLETLNFNIGSAVLALNPNGQIWPRVLNTYIGGRSGGIYSVIANLCDPTGVGMDFSFGQLFLERFYTVFDVTHQRIGFATTSYTQATSN